VPRGLDSQLRLFEGSLAVPAVTSRPLSSSLKGGSAKADPCITSIKHAAFKTRLRKSTSLTPAKIFGNTMDATEETFRILYQAVMISSQLADKNKKP
jgi:hypothetical protein